MVSKEIESDICQSCKMEEVENNVRDLRNSNRVLGVRKVSLFLSSTETDN